MCTDWKVSRDSPRLCFSPHISKLCSRETNRHVALALQWRMKVHGARQTSIPLQPPLSNKHIYYSDRARLEVSPHTPPTGCNPGQWDSGCSTPGISTGTRKKENKWSSHFFFSLPAEESRAIAAVYILQERVSSPDDVLWYFFFFFCSPAGTINGPFSTIIFYNTDEHDITSTELVCSIHWLHCIIVINGDLSTLALYN